MKRILLLLVSLLAVFAADASPRKKKDKIKDRYYLLAYATEKDNNHNGLHLAWKFNDGEWNPIGPEYGFVKSDYGRWGSQKRMINPYLFRGNDGVWHCVWTLNEQDGALGVASSVDLIHWGRQYYPVVMPDGGNCVDPTVSYNEVKDVYEIVWKSFNQNDARSYMTTTKDFRSFGETTFYEVPFRFLPAPETVAGEQVRGNTFEVSKSEIDVLIAEHGRITVRNALNAETTTDDSVRFAGLEPLTATLSINSAESKPISDMLIGIFFEDINYSADGGLYAELVQNRDFEYALSDKEGYDKNWNSRTAWTATGDASFKIETLDPIHHNNPHYAVLTIGNVGGGLVNEGFDGIALKGSEKYIFTAFVRSPEVQRGQLMVYLRGADGTILGEAVTTDSVSEEWTRLETVITIQESADNAVLEIIPQMTGRVDLDMISLFPVNTFKGRKNGLRADLAQTLADLNPRFVRFPGGCVAHGDGIENIYNWKNTIGALEERVPMRNLWGYHQTAGLGYYEYFLFCEDLGAEPVPVVAAGVPCQNSAHHGHPIGGQQGGIPMCDMDAYVQDILDLIEYANGDVSTRWGAVRAEAGHPEPFNLKFLGVGNEDLITDIFEERFTMIYDAVCERYPEITVIGTVGPFYEGTDYVEGWKLAGKLGIPMVDEHYYNPPGWFIHNQDFYDNYDRNGSRVYLGEYAAHLPERFPTIETALAEALHLTNVERNGDVITMTSFAPLLAKEGHTQWNPDLIYFNNTEVKPTVGYHVQRLFGENQGDEYINSTLALSEEREAVALRVSRSVVRDTKTGDVIVKTVNLLPVEVTMSIDSDGRYESAERTVLTGSPTDREAAITTDTLAAGSSYTLPPYSFTVLRFKEAR